MIWIPLLAAVAASIFDLRRREIPDTITVSIGVAGIVSAAMAADASELSLGQSVASFALVFAVAVVAAWRGGFGGGDVKLLAGLAAWLPVGGALAMLFWTAIVGAVLAIISGLRGKKDLAYGPAIAAGFAAAALAPGALPAVVAGMRSAMGLPNE